MRKFMAMALLVCVAGCGDSSEPKADTSSPKHYAKDGLAFDYPANWRVTEDSVEANGRYLFVETPGEAIVAVLITPASQAADLAEASQNYSDMAASSTPIGTIHGGSFGPVSRSGDYEKRTETFTITVLSESVPHTRIFYRRVVGPEACMIVQQVADEDLSAVSAGFEQVFNSLQYAPAGQ